MAEIVSQITKKELRPKVARKFEAYLPAVFATAFSFVLTGVNVSVANGLRKAMGGEIFVKRLTCEVEDIVTNDVFLIAEEVIKQINCIPISQSIPVGSKFLFSAENPTTQLLTVHTASIKPEPGTKLAKGFLFNTNIAVSDLHPATFIKVPLRVVEGLPKNSGCGMSVVAALCAAVPLDVKPLLPYKIEGDRVVPDISGATGTPSSMSDPRKHLVSFTTNGTMEPEVIVKTACNTLAERCQNIIDVKGEFKLEDGDDPEYQLEINENATMGEIFMRFVLDTAPDVRLVTYKDDKISAGITLRCKCDDIDQVVETAMRMAKSQFIAIGRAF